MVIDQLPCRFVEQQGVTVVGFMDTELVDRARLAAVERQLTTLVEHVRPDIVIDFKGVNSVSSDMIGILVALRKRVRALGGRLAMVGGSAGVLDAVRMTCLDSLIPLYESLDAALANR